VSLFYIPELRFPGTDLVYPETENYWPIKERFDEFCWWLADGALALDLYVKARDGNDDLSAAPYEVVRRRQSLHARSYLLAMDRVEKSFGQLVALAPGLTEAKRTFDAAFPHLRGVRNSVSHYEDRARFLGPGGKRIFAKPIAHRGITAPAGVMITELVGEDYYGVTIADGTIGEVEVSQASLRAATLAVQQAIDAFDWEGAPTHWPEEALPIGRRLVKR
jgi:hypothetical protein